MCLFRRMLKLDAGWVILAATALAVTVCAGGKGWAAGDEAAAAKATIEVKSVLENLQAAFGGESNAHARYLAFAKKADEEGYAEVAALFRAAARSEAIHAKNHEAAIRKLGGKAEAKIAEPAVRSTRENLQAAIEGETYEFETMYPAFLKEARQEKSRDAIRTFNFAREVETEHAALYKEALNNLDAWKAKGKTFYVCPVCGRTMKALDGKKCPVCFTPEEKFIKIS